MGFVALRLGSHMTPSISLQTSTEARCTFDLSVGSKVGDILSATFRVLVLCLQQGRVISDSPVRLYCSPSAKLRCSYKDQSGNLIVRMNKADLQLDLGQRAQVVWGDLQSPHHILDASGNAPFLKLPYGPSSNRTDTLFYLTAAE